MQNIIVKVYGSLQPCAKEDIIFLMGALQTLGEDASAVLKLEGNLLHISYEGVYFPIEDFLAVLATLLRQDSKGRIDYIDMEEWTLVRYSFDNGFITSSKRGLNDVLAFSGH